MYGRYVEADSRTIDPTTARRLVERQCSVGGEDAGAEGGHGCRGIHLTGGEHLVAQAVDQEAAPELAQRWGRRLYGQGSGGVRALWMQTEVPRMLSRRDASETVPTMDAEAIDCASRGRIKSCFCRVKCCGVRNTARS